MSGEKIFKMIEQFTCTYVLPGAIPVFATDTGSFVLHPGQGKGFVKSLSASRLYIMCRVSYK